MLAALARREDLTLRLWKTLQHLPPAQILSIVASFYSLEELEKIVKFQENRD